MPQVPGSAIAVEVDDKGVQYVVNWMGVVYQKENATWTKIGSNVRDIAIGNGNQIWTLGKTDGQPH